MGLSNVLSGSTLSNTYHIKNIYYRYVKYASANSDRTTIYNYSTIYNTDIATAVTNVNTIFKTFFDSFSNNTTTGAVSLTQPYYCPYEYNIPANSSYGFNLKKAFDDAADVLQKCTNITESFSSIRTSPGTFVGDFNRIVDQTIVLCRDANYFFKTDIPLVNAPIIAVGDISSSPYYILRVNPEKIKPLLDKVNLCKTTLTNIRNNQMFTQVNAATQPLYATGDVTVIAVFDKLIEAFTAVINVMNNQYNNIDNTKYQNIIANRGQIDANMKELYQMPDSATDVYRQQYTGTMMAGAMWTVLATSLLYYVFTEL
jgi:hypothetical protein